MLNRKETEHKATQNSKEKILHHRGLTQTLEGWHGRKAAWWAAGSNRQAAQCHRVMQRGLRKQARSAGVGQAGVIVRAL